MYEMNASLPKANPPSHTSYLMEHEKRLAELEQRMNAVYQRLAQLEEIVGVQVPETDLHG